MISIATGAAVLESSTSRNREREAIWVAFAEHFLDKRPATRVYASLCAASLHRPAAAGFALATHEQVRVLRARRPPLALRTSYFGSVSLETSGITTGGKDSASQLGVRLLYESPLLAPAAPTARF